MSDTDQKITDKIDVNKIHVNKIHDKPINFLIGSGASFGLFPTLALQCKNEKNESYTIETLATKCEEDKNDELKTILFMHYYQSCIKPIIEFHPNKIKQETDDKKREVKEKVIENYKKFIENIVSILSKKTARQTRHCNIFTTNYDACFTHAIDELIQEGEQIILNDGSRGFHKRYLHAKNFNSCTVEHSVFNQHSNYLPQINLIHLHGSVNWVKNGDNILVDYNKKQCLIKQIDAQIPDISAFSAIFNSETISNFTNQTPFPDRSGFWQLYNQLPIVNPTKWKFHETVFEEHYYQMLRFLSYELESNDSILITFGFSFADEHILRLVQRSLQNSTLMVYICCFNDNEKNALYAKFSSYPNVKFIVANEGVLNFDYFNKNVFSPLANHEVK